MCLFLYWSQDLEQFGIENDSDDLKWQKHVLEHAEKAGLDLAKSGMYGMGEILESYTVNYEDIAAIKGAARSDRWKWKKAVSIPHRKACRSLSLQNRLAQELYQSLWLKGQNWW